MTDEELRAKIEKGVDRNILAFDPEATGTVTKRLIYGMWSISLDKLTRLHIPTDAFPEFDFYERQYGVQIVRDRRLNIKGSENFIDEFNIHPAPGKSLLVVGVWDDECLLGMV
jgi:hypothetical protein